MSNDGEFHRRQLIMIPSTRREQEQRPSGQNKRRKVLLFCLIRSKYFLGKSFTPWAYS